MIVEVFGRDGIFPWHPAYYRFLRKVAPHRTVKFDDYKRYFTESELRYQLGGIIYIHLAGRAASTCASFLDRYPPESYLTKYCFRDLSSPVHAHIDPMGNYLTGFCSGLRIGGEGTAYELKKLYQLGITLEDYPLLDMLIHGTLGDLFSFSVTQGFTPDIRGYVSACHLCGHIRTWLFVRSTRERRYQELGPSFFYEEMARLLPV